MIMIKLYKENKMVFTSRIGFQFAAVNATQFKTFNCLKNEENTTIFCVASIEETKQAAALAKEAFRTYKNTTSSTRVQFLNAIADELDNKRIELIAVFCKEASLSEERANVELDRTIFQLQNYGNQLVNTDWNRPIISTVATHSTTISTQLEAIGPVVIFGSSNFPFAYSTAGGDTASALATGCPVIVKAHPMHAETSYLVAECILKVAQEMNLPNGVFSHLLDNGYEVGAELLSNKYIKAVGFTGSIKGGRALMDISAKRNAPIPVFAEMGSVNPVVFFETATNEKLDYWVEKYATSISTDAGQFCTKPGLLFLPHTPISEQFIARLQAQLAAIAPKCHLHPNLFSSFKKQVEKSFDWIHCEQPFHSQPVLRKVEVAEFLSNENVRQEFFGPQSIAILYSSVKELENMLNHLDGQLTATLIGSQNEFDAHADVIELLKEKAGRIILNGVPTGVTVCDAMVHGGTYPAASDSRFTAVGTQSIYRFLRPIAVQENN